MDVNTREGYVQALTSEGCILQKVIDIPVRAVPPGYGPVEVFQKYLDLPFCLIVLAQKPSY